MTLEEWEAHPDLHSVKDEELRDVLKHVFGIRSAAYFLSKAEKITFIQDELSRPRFLELAADRRTNYRKPTPLFTEKVLSNAGKKPWRFLGHDDAAAGIVDPLSGRQNIRKVVTLTRGRKTIQVHARTCEVLIAHNLLSGYIPRTKPRWFRSHKPEGVRSVSDILTGNVVVGEETCEDMVPPEPERQVIPEPAPLVENIDLADLVETQDISEPEVAEEPDEEKSMEDLLQEIFG